MLIEPGAPFFADAAQGNRHYRLGYSSIPAARIAAGISQIADTLNPANWL